MPTIEEVYTFYKRLNDDAIAENDLDDVVPFSDVDFYAEQIELEFLVSPAEARSLAEELAKRV